MPSDSRVKVLLVAEGSGGHLIPALQVASALAEGGAQATVWYAERPQLMPLSRALTQAMRDRSIEVDAIPMPAGSRPLGRLWRSRQLWRLAQRYLTVVSPDVIVGFGGWISAPVLVAACLRRTTFRFPWHGRQATPRRIRCVLHEQNVELGRANRWLAPWVDRVAVSFPETQPRLNGNHAVWTGMPIRRQIGEVSREEGATQFGFDAHRPTILILGGSQGARAINHLVGRSVAHFTSDERSRWQLIHVTGVADEREVREAYASHGVTAWVSPFLVEMELAYAAADVVIARAGASTIAELARCGSPALLIPYPYAGGHQRRNAAMAESIGGGLMLEESQATPPRLLEMVRRLLADERLRLMMGNQMRRLDCLDATGRLRDTILELARGDAPYMGDGHRSVGCE